MGFASPPAAAKPCRAARRDAGPGFTTAQTVVIGTPEQMAASAAALWEKGATLLKIKLDARLISERMVAIRSAVPEATLIVDANGWSIRKTGFCRLRYALFMTGAKRR